MHGAHGVPLPGTDARFFKGDPEPLQAQERTRPAVGCTEAEVHSALEDSAEHRLRTTIEKMLGTLRGVALERHLNANGPQPIPSVGRSYRDVAVPASPKRPGSARRSVENEVTGREFNQRAVAAMFGRMVENYARRSGIGVVQNQFPRIKHLRPHSLGDG